MRIKAILFVNDRMAKWSETWVTDGDKYEQKRAIKKFISGFKRLCREKIEKYDYKIFLQVGSKMNEHG